ncbi:HAMP domain-containing sensor histidine kinase [Fusobacterium sp.]|jgi:two-component system sensor histidine kinase VanS|uniref:sensor histidine kinase n=1 Tax=Fusobacterium sp. TaxID=68766 RepID=UPI0015A67720|nr:HAMP domain-containing sensor histidine kinase [Fusobacterium sp.]MDY3058710.1 HAMP domain-containing sensor histidine kinase [Fusobacterium sp.]
MKIRWKIFFLMFSVVLMIILGLIATNTIYLEKFYIKNKKEKLVELGQILIDPKYVIDFQNLEMHSNVAILIKRTDELYKLEKEAVLPKEEIDEIIVQLKNNEYVFKEITLLDYRGKVLILFMPYMRDRYIEIITPLSFIQEGLEISTRYHLLIIVLALIIGSSMSFVFSKKMTDPILELKEITQRISLLDFNIKFEKERKDEIGELGYAINKMGGTLEKNIDEINKVNKKLMEDIENEKRLDKLRKEFIASVSHELKTPIAIIQGYAQGLMENIAETEEDRNFYCEIIVEESLKMDSLVKELLLITQMDSGYFKIEKEKVDLYQMIKDIRDKYSSKNREIKYIGEKDIFAYCDEKYIDRVLENLVVNALKYSTGDREVTITVEDIENRYKVIISNESENLSEDDLENIWTPFYRVNKARDRDGHGLGLAIVRGILENHKSNFGVYITEKNIINFWFELEKSSLDSYEKIDNEDIEEI